MTVVSPEYQQNWRRKNPGAAARHSAVYRLKHPERTARSKQKWMSKNFFYFKAKNLMRKFGLPLSRWCEMAIAQHWRCAICGDLFITWSKIAVDHNHLKQKGDPGFVRELLCHPCNTMLGYAHESPDRLRAAATYLEKHQ